jgi:anthranilate synthase component II
MITKILLIDNYDSFTYNLVHLLLSLPNVEVDVVYNDAITLAEANTYKNIVFSPGQGLPKNAGITKKIIKTFASSKKMLGVCLGHQAIVEAFGGTLINASTPFHGIATAINVTNLQEPLFANLPNKFNVGRYHSWLANPNTLPSCFQITATDTQQNIMAISHKTFAIKGIQFHPESILSQFGKDLMQNWIES